MAILCSQSAEAEKSGLASRLDGDDSKWPSQFRRDFHGIPNPTTEVIRVFELLGPGSRFRPEQANLSSLRRYAQPGPLFAVHVVGDRDAAIQTKITPGQECQAARASRIARDGNSFAFTYGRDKRLVFDAQSEIPACGRLPWSFERQTSEKRCDSEPERTPQDMNATVPSRRLSAAAALRLPGASPAPGTGACCHHGRLIPQHNPYS